MVVTKSDVERHIKKVERHLNSGHERSLKGLSFAELFRKANEPELAKRHVLAYISVSGNDYRGHKFLGELLEESQDYFGALESYKRCITLNRDQNDVLLKIVKLYTELDVDPKIAKAWADKASKRIPGHPAIFNLQVHLIELNKPVDYNELINLIAEELTQRPRDCTVHIKLVDTYIKTNQLEEAFSHCIAVNKTKAFNDNLSWFVFTVDVLERYLEWKELQVKDHSPQSRLTILQEIYMNILASYCILVELNLKEAGLRNTSKSLLRLDQLLYQAVNLDNGLSNSTDLGDANEWDVAITEIRAQLYMLSGHLLLRLAKEGYSAWSNALEMATACYVTSLRVLEAEMYSSWSAQASRRQKNPFKWSIMAASRLSQTGHLVLAILDRYGEEKIENILSNWCSPQGQEDILTTLYGHHQDFSKLFLSEDESFLSPELVIPEHLIKYDEVFIKDNPLNLQTIVWIGLHWYQHDEHIKPGVGVLASRLFDGLRMDVPDIRQCSADFICLRDVEAFIYAAVRCSAQSILDDVDVVYEYYQPKLLPICLSAPFCITSQYQWWEAAFTLYNGTVGVSNSGKVKLTVQRGLEQIRALKSHGMHPRLVIYLAINFRQKSLTLKDAAGYSPWHYSEHWKSLELRSLHYWDVALGLLEGMKRNQNPGIPKDPLFPNNLSHLEEHDIHRFFREACVILGEDAVRRGEFETALQFFNQVETSHAAWNEAQIYKYLAGLESRGAAIDDRVYAAYIKYLKDAKERMIVCLERLEHNKVVRDAVEEELAELESLLQERKSLYRVDPRKSLDFHQLDFDALRSPVSSDITESGEPIPLKENDTRELLATVSEVTLDNGFLREQVSIRDEQVLRLSKQLQELQNELCRYKDGALSPASFSYPLARTPSSSLEDYQPSSHVSQLEIGGQFIRQGTFLDNTVVPTDRCGDPSFFSGLSNSNTPETSRTREDEGDAENDTRDSLRQVEEERDSNETSENEDEDNIHFEPIVQLPLAVEMKSGEEDEDVVFEERVKLFRYDNQEWKERGIGNLKLLWNDNTGKARILMRREIVHKLCANHYLTPKMSLMPGIGSKPSYVWSTLFDYSDEEVKPEKFAAKFTTAEMAEDFEVKFKELQQREQVHKSKISPEISHFEKPDAEAASAFSSSTPFKSSQLATGTTPGPILVTTPDDRSPSPTSPVMQQHSFTLNAGEPADPGQQSQDVPTPFTLITSNNKEPSDKPFRLQLFGAQPTSGTFAPPAQPVQSQNQNQDFRFQPPSFQQQIHKPEEGALQSQTTKPMSTFSFTFPSKPESSSNKPDDNQLRDGSPFRLTKVTDGKEFGAQATSGIFTPQDQPLQSQIQTRGFRFQPPGFQQQIPKPDDDTLQFQATKPMSTFSFTFPSKPESSSNKPDDNQLRDQSPFHLTKVADDKEFGGKKVENIFGTTTNKGGFDFKELTERCSDGETPGLSSPNNLGFRGFGRQVFSQPDNERDHDNEEHDDGIDIKPIVSLPLVYDHATGEEGETVRFSARAKLYRFANETKEWKERGIGVIKLLYNALTGQSRVVMRRDQVHKVCANHMIVPTMKLNAKSDRSWMWLTPCDIADGEPSVQQLTVKFKQKETASEFKKIFEELQSIAPTSKSYDPDADQDTSVDDTQSANDEPSSEKPPGVDDWKLKFQPSEGSWQCDTCLVRNKKEDSQCAACQTPKSGTDNPQNLSKPIFGTSAPSSSGFKFGFQTLPDNAVKSRFTSNSGFQFGSTQETSMEPSSDANINRGGLASGPLFNFGSLNNAKENRLSGQSGFVFGSQNQGTESNKPGLIFGSQEPKNEEDISGDSSPSTDDENSSQDSFVFGSQQEGTEFSKPGLGSSLPDHPTFCFNTEPSNETSSNMDTVNLKSLFQPPKGSWKCDTCLIQNTEQAVNCIACQSPKPCTDTLQQTSSPSSGQPRTSPIIETANSKKDLKSLFQAPKGSWKCDTCLLQNSKEDFTCIACQLPKPGTDPLQQTSSPFVGQPTFPSSSATSSTGFVFGSPKQSSSSGESSSKPTFSFGNNSAPSTGFTFGFKPSTEEGTTSGFSIPESKPDFAQSGFVFGSPVQSKPTESSKVVESEKTKPDVKKPDPIDLSHGDFTFRLDVSKALNTTPETSPVKHESDADPEKEDENLVFKPIASLPINIDKSTGEENEITKFCNRAKLYRFVEGLWKERGVGEMKVLFDARRHRGRVVMRRDQVHILCANHYISRDMMLKPHGSSEKCWTWHAIGDIADNEVKDELLAVKFKDSETASAFKDAFVYCSTNQGSSLPSDVKPNTDEQKTATKIDLQSMFQPPSGSWKCDTCLVQNSEETVSCAACQSFKPGTEPSKQSASSLPVPPIRSLKTAVSSETPPNIDTATPKSDLKSLFQPPKGSWKCDTCLIQNTEQAASCIACQSPKSGTDSLQQTSSPFLGQPTFPSSSATSSTGFVFGSPKQSSSSGESSSKSTFSFGNNSAPSTGFTFGFKPSTKEGTTSGFTIPESKPYFAQSGFVFGSPAQSKPTESSKVVESEKTKPDVKKPDPIDLSHGDFTFRLDVSKALNTTPETSPVKHEVGVDPEKEDENLVFKPIASLPTNIDKSTGEENEITKFCNRAKLYRFVEGLWKERGVGEMKLLFDARRHRGRVVMRRDQVHILCANHYISRDMILKPHGSSEKCWTWYAIGDIADNEVRDELFAVKFKDSETASAFKDAFDYCAKHNNSSLASDVDDDDEVQLIREVCATEDQRKQAEKYLLPPNFYLYIAKEETTEPIPKSKSQDSSHVPSQRVQEPSSNKTFLFGSPDISSLSFGALASGLSPKGFFKSPQGEGFVGTGAQLFTEDKTNEEEYDPEAEATGVHYKPIVHLPDQVEHSTGEENEDIVYCERAKLFRFDQDTGQWKERGVGNLKLLKHKTTGQVRILMRRDQIFKLCANHFLTADMELKPNAGSDRSWVWYTSGDISDGEAKDERLAARFKNAEIAKQFKEKFELCQSETFNSVAGTETSIESDQEHSTVEGSSIFKELQPTKSPVSTVEPSTTEEKLGVNLGTTEGSKTAEDSDIPKDLDTKVKSSSDQLQDTAFQFGSLETSSLSFGSLAAMSSGFAKSDEGSSGFAGAGKTLFGQPSNNDEENYDPEKETDGHFQPVVSLPTNVDFQTGEEDETILYSHRAKLFRYDSEIKQWKERGIGVIKILENNKTNRYRVVMRREQIHKLCANHYITLEMELKENAGSDRSWVWSVDADFTDGIPRQELLAIRFKHQVDAEAFRQQFLECQEKLTEQSESDDNKRKNVELNNASEEDQGDESDDDVVITFEKRPSEQQKRRAQKYQLPETFYCGDIGDGEDAVSQQSMNDTKSTPDVNQTPENDVSDVPSGSFLFGSPNISSLSFDDFAKSVNTKSGFGFDKSPQDKGFFGTGAKLFLNKTAEKEDDTEYDPEAEATGVHYKPIVHLPDQVEHSTGEENEDIVYCERAKLFRFYQDAGQWKERGVGNLKLLKHKTTGQVRILMRREQIFKLCANHFLTADMELKPNAGSDRSWVWHTSGDISDGEAKEERLAARFKNAEIAKQFKEQFDTCKEELFETATESEEDMIGDDRGKDTKKGKSNEEGRSTEQPSTTEHPGTSEQPDITEHPGTTELPDITGHLSASEHPSSTTDPDTTEQPATSEQPEYPGTTREMGTIQFGSLETSSLSFGSLAAMSSGFAKSDKGSSGFAGAGKTLFGQPSNNDEENYDPEKETEGHFQPIISLPTNVDFQTGEEDETILYSHRAKLFRYDSEIKQWKERGIGVIKILENNKTNRYRVVMRREQIHKLCANHYIALEMELKENAGSDRSWIWSVDADFTDGIPRQELLAIRFKHQVDAEAFRQQFLECQEKLKEQSESDDNKIKNVELNNTSEEDQGDESDDASQHPDSTEQPSTTQHPDTTEHPGSSEHPDTEQPGTTEKPDSTEQASTTEKPTTTEYPDSTEQPGTTEKPGSTEQPSTTEKPSTTEYPDSTEQPSTTEKPDSTEQPSTTEKPDGTEQPSTTEKPDGTEHPGTTEHPDTTEYPDSTEQPSTTEKPDGTEHPGTTEHPDTTEYPDSTEQSSTTEKPDGTEHPGTTEHPDTTEYPDSTEQPDTTEYPDTTEQPGTTEKPVTTEQPSTTKHPDSIELPDTTKYPDTTEYPDTTGYLDTTEQPSTSGQAGTTEQSLTTKHPDNTEYQDTTKQPSTTEKLITREIPKITLGTSGEPNTTCSDDVVITFEKKPSVQQQTHAKEYELPKTFYCEDVSGDEDVSCQQTTNDAKSDSIDQFNASETLHEVPSSEQDKQSGTIGAAKGYSVADDTESHTHASIVLDDVNQSFTTRPSYAKVAATGVLKGVKKVGENAPADPKQRGFIEKAPVTITDTVRSRDDTIGAKKDLTSSGRETTDVEKTGDKNCIESETLNADEESTGTDRSLAKETSVAFDVSATSVMKSTRPGTVCEPVADTLTEASTDIGESTDIARKDTSDDTTNVIPDEEDDVVVTYENIPSPEQKQRAERHSLPERFFADKKTKSGSTKSKRHSPLRSPGAMQSCMFGSSAISSLSFGAIAAGLSPKSKSPKTSPRSRSHKETKRKDGGEDHAEKESSDASYITDEEKRQSDEQVSSNCSSQSFVFGAPAISSFSFASVAGSVGSKPSHTKSHHKKRSPGAGRQLFEEEKRKQMTSDDYDTGAEATGVHYKPIKNDEIGEEKTREEKSENVFAEENTTCQIQPSGEPCTFESTLKVALKPTRKPVVSPKPRKLSEEYKHRGSSESDEFTMSSTSYYTVTSERKVITSVQEYKTEPVIERKVITTYAVPPEFVTSIDTAGASVLFNHNAKIFSFDELQDCWVEKGSGILQIIDHEKQFHIFMVDSNTSEICVAHQITPAMDLKPNAGSDRSWVWSDYSDNPAEPHELAAEFPTVEASLEYKKKFEECRDSCGVPHEGHVRAMAASFNSNVHDLPKIITSQKKVIQGTGHPLWSVCPDCHVENNVNNASCSVCGAELDQWSTGGQFIVRKLQVVNVKPTPTPKPTDNIKDKEEVGTLGPEQIKDEKKDISVVRWWTCSGCGVENHENNDVCSVCSLAKPHQAEKLSSLEPSTEKDTTETTLTFGSSLSQPLSFSDIAASTTLHISTSSTGFPGRGSQLFVETPDDVAMSSASFDVLTGKHIKETEDENDQCMFTQHVKLFRFNSSAGEWKEKGCGALKILKNSITQRARVVMHRDQVLSLCANHYITSTMELRPPDDSDKVWIWTAQDYSSGEMLVEQLAAVFKTDALAADFKEVFDECRHNDNSATEASEIQLFEGIPTCSPNISRLLSEMIKK